MSTQQIEWTERDLTCAQAVLQAGPEVELPTLTDEEIVALDGVERPQLVPLPFLDGQTVERRALATVALRGLLAKQIAFPITPEGETEPSRLGVRTDITGILTLRRSGQRIVSGERRSAAGTHWLFGYVHGEQVLEEQISDAGVHAFEVYPVGQLVDRLTVLVDRDAAAADDGVPQVLEERDFETGAPVIFADAHTVTTIAAGGVEADTEAAVTVYAEPTRVRTLDASRGLSGMEYSIVDVSSVTLRRRLADDVVRLGK